MREERRSGRRHRRLAAADAAAAAVSVLGLAAACRAPTASSSSSSGVARAGSAEAGAGLPRPLATTRESLATRRSHSASAAAAASGDRTRLRAGRTSPRFLQDDNATTCSSDMLETCAPCCQERTTRYNCSLPGLESMTPGGYAGVSVNYLSFATETSSPNFPVRAAEFERCTGGRIVFSEAANVWEDPIHDLGTKTSKGQEVYDGYFMSYSHFPEASALDLAEHLNDRIRADNDRLKWEDVLPKVRAMGEYRKDGVTNLDFLMYDGDFFVPIVRLDLLEKHNKSLPNTWEEVVDLASEFNGTDLNDDNITDFGFCHFPRLGAGYWDWWWPEALYSTWATYGQTEGLFQGFFFDDDTMEPRIDAGFEKSAEIWSTLWTNGADGCITDNFITGRCAVGFAPPGCWKGVFRRPADEPLGPDGVYYGVRRKDENGTVVWRPTMRDGSYAEPYRFKPFGTTEVLNRETGEMEECTAELCPKAEPAPARGHWGDDDRASVLEPSPLEGRLINRAPFYWSGGLGTLIRKSAEETKKDMMWDFFVYTNSPDTSVHDVANYDSWLDSWRSAQLSPGDNFLDGGWSEGAYREHSAVMQWALSKESNGALNLRIPGLARYTRDTVGERMGKYIDGTMTLKQLVAEVDAGWRAITADEGTLDQLEIYRAALGEDAHSEFDLCQLHRDLMDHKDPSICRKYDPPPDNMVLIIVLISVLGSIIVFGAVGFGVWWVVRTYRQKKRLELERERQYANTIKESLENMQELQHPMVLIPAKRFLEIGSLKSYEHLRDSQGDNLKVLDNMDVVHDFKRDHLIVFLSHQWLGWGIPDPNNTHYNAMCRAVLRAPEMLAADHGGTVDMDRVYVWVDFVSISQAHRGLQSLAIGSLPAYASAADCFAIIAPNALHRDSKTMCDPGTYNMRGWCRAEMLSKICASGLRNMYLVSGDGMKMESVTEETPLSFKLFEGDFSCCQLRHTVGTGACDKESLRVPALGLYSIALRRAHDEHVQQVLENMRAERESFFPTEYTFVAEEGEERRELFGPLIEKMERYIEEKFPDAASVEAMKDDRAHRTNSELFGIYADEEKKKVMKSTRNLNAGDAGRVDVEDPREGPKESKFADEPTKEETLTNDLAERGTRGSDNTAPTSSSGPS